MVKLNILHRTYSATETLRQIAWQPKQCLITLYMTSFMWLGKIYAVP